MKRQRRKHSAEFQARVALEALKGLKTVNEMTAEFEIHPVMVNNWKKEMLMHLPEVFEKNNAKKTIGKDKETEDLQRKAGQLTMEVDFLEKKCKQLGIPVKGRNS
jgi:putative transposase